jgi:hypothetical protein
MRYRKHLFLLQEGVAVAGTVVSKSEQRSGRSTTYRVTYSFTAEGQPVWQTSAVPGSFENAVYPGAYITVLYNPSNPKDCFPYRALSYATL